MEHVKNQVVTKLVQFRKLRGMSQKGLAEKIGIDPASLCKYESGKIDPSLTMLTRWSIALNCSLLVATNDYPYKVHIDSEKMLNEWQEFIQKT